MSNQSDRIPTLVGDMNVKNPVDCVATSNVALTGEQTIDGFTTNGSRVLLTGQTDATTNGIYLSDTGSWIRDADCDGPRQLTKGTLIFSRSGTSRGNTWWYCTTTGTLVADGSMALNFALAGTPLAIISAFMQTVLTAANAAAARADLGAIGFADNIAFTGNNTHAGLETFIDSEFVIVDNGDATKQVAIQASGITTGTTRTLTVPDKSGTLAMTSDITNPFLTVTATVGSSALTLGLAATTLMFRNVSLTSGAPTTVVLGSTASVVVPSTATLGTISAIGARLILVALNVVGVIELAVVNLAGANNLDETTLISTTAVTTGATAANVFYSTTQRTNVPFRVVGFVDITEATAGTWATAPTTIQGLGGQAVSSLQSYGFGQSWVDLSASKSAATTYYNTTGRAISVMIQSTLSDSMVLTVNGVAMNLSGTDGTNRATCSVEIPPGHSYNLSSGSFNKWYEMR